MTAREQFPEGALTLEQWQLLDQLGRTIEPAQARWISGYFAGFDAGLARAGLGDGHTASLIVPVALPQSRTLTVLYGSETGNCAALARGLGAAAIERGLTADVVDMASYKPRRLKEEQDLLLIASTYGEGDPPQPAIGFFEFLESTRAPRLEGVRFAVLALGDSSYEKYCEAGKRLDRRLDELGAKRLADRVDCDIDFEEPAAAWSAALLELLAADAGAFTVKPSVQPNPFPVAATRHDKQNPFNARILDKLTIVGRGSTKETRHVELDLAGSGLSYEPGDSLGVAVTNEEPVVEAVLQAAGLSGAAHVSVKGESLTLLEALRGRFEITLATPRFLDHWARLGGSPELAALGGEDKSAERVAYLRGHHIVDILRRFPVGGIDAETFIAGLRPLQPRLYSIASSLAATPDEVHLTVAPVRYELHGSARKGVASSLIADRCEAGSVLPVYVQQNPHFRLPADDVPIIMVGAGTGVAPYRAFLQEREARGAGGRSWLFFGERNFRSDFLYQAEWHEHLKAGVLTRMDVAFSRDKAGRVYVQRRLHERAPELYAWLEEGAHFYVCGDAAGMAPDVHQALIDIVAGEGGRGREAAEDYVRTLQQAARYQRDVY